MKQEGLAYFYDTYLTVLALVIFFVFFLAVIVLTFHKSRKNHYQQISQMPLNDEQQGEDDVQS